MTTTVFGTSCGKESAHYTGRRVSPTRAHTHACPHVLRKRNGSSRAKPPGRERTSAALARADQCRPSASAAHSAGVGKSGRWRQQIRRAMPSAHRSTHRVQPHPPPRAHLRQHVDLAATKHERRENALDSVDERSVVGRAPGENALRHARTHSAHAVNSVRRARSEALAGARAGWSAGPGEDVAGVSRSPGADVAAVHAHSRRRAMHAQFACNR